MKKILTLLIQQQHLSRSEAKDILCRMAKGEFNDSQIAAFITVYLMRSIRIEEFLGFTDALLELCDDLSALRKYDPIDIVGTGGDGKNTFNISTLACFTVAAAGYKVAKHGNYGASSISGASTVMETLGIKFTKDVDKLEKSLAESNMAFLHAPFFNDALKVVAPIRKELGVRTFFNMLGPAVNPIRNKRSVLGVFDLKMARMYRYMYQHTDVDYAIVHSLDGYDEISLTHDFKVITNKSEFIYSPESFSMNRCMQQDLYSGNTAMDAAKIFIDVVENRATEAQKNTVIMNAAVGISIIEKEMSHLECINKAREAIESGRLKDTFNRFVELNK